MSQVDGRDPVISLIHRKAAKSKGREIPGYGLFVTEEILFWGGLGALATGSGWITVMGGIVLATSIVMVILLISRA